MFKSIKKKHLHSKKDLIFNVEFSRSFQQSENVGLSCADPEGGGGGRGPGSTLKIIKIQGFLAILVQIP